MTPSWHHRGTLVTPWHPDTSCGLAGPSLAFRRAGPIILPRRAPALAPGVFMIPLWDLVRMLVAQQCGPQRLGRVPEPSQLTDAPPNVTQYNRVMTTKLVLAYALGLELVHRARPTVGGGSALDLACGP